MTGHPPDEPARFAYLTKKHRVVFRLVHSRAATNRSVLSRQLGLNASSLGYIVGQLIEWGFLREGEREPVPRGQPVISLEVAREGYFQCGVSITAQKISLGLANLRGELLSHRDYVGDFGNPRNTCDFIAATLEDDFAKHGLDPEKCLGLGHAVPGNLINHGEYYITPDALIEWSGFRVGDYLSRALHLSVFLENDAKAGAVGELLRGHGAAIRSFYYAGLGHGLGGAYVENTKVIRGAQGNFGELGAILPAGRVRPTLPSLGEALGLTPAETLTTDLMADIAAQRPAYERWVDEAGTQFAAALDIIAKLMRPEAIILASKLPPAVLDDIRARVEFSPFNPPRYREILHPRLLVSALDPALAELIGATLLPVHRVLY